MSPGQSRVFIIAPHNSYRIAAYLNAARDMGVDTTIVSNSKQSLVNEIAAGLHVDFSNFEDCIEKILLAARQSTITGIVATDDRTVEIAAQVATTLGLPCNPPQSTRISRWKHLARQTLRDAGLPVPRFKLVKLADNLQAQVAEFTFPCVLKPLNMSASRGVIRCNNLEELTMAAQRIRAIIQESEESMAKEHLLLEEYIPGVEVALEAMLVNGSLKTLALFDKPDPLEGPYFEETYYVTPSRLDSGVQQKIMDITASACEAMGLKTGPVHAELRINNGEISIIEIAARTIGGECARLLENTVGHSLETLVIANATGKMLQTQHNKQSAGVLMIPTPRPGVLRRVEGVLNAARIPHIDDVFIAIREGHELQTLPEGSGYLGFIFASADKPETVERALRDAHSCLNIVVAPLWKLASINPTG